MNIDILGVPERFENADGIETPSSVKSPVQNGIATGGPNPNMTNADAHAALKALAIQDGWWALYDPTNTASLTTDGSGNVTAIADSLGNGPTLTLYTGQTAKTAVQLGALQAVRSIFWGNVAQQDYFAMGAGAYSNQSQAYLFAGIGPSATDVNNRPYGVVSSDVIAQGSRADENVTYSDVFASKTIATTAPAPSVWGFDTSSGDLYYGQHLLSPDAEPISKQINPPNGIAFGTNSAVASGMAGPLVLATATPSKETRLRMNDMLTKLSGAPVTISTDDGVAVESYATLDEGGNLTAALRPWKPVQTASVVKVMMAHVARKYVTDAMLDNLVAVVDPYLPTDNRYPSVYTGDTLSWRDLFTIVNHRSHNRLSSTLAYHAEKVRNPTGSGTTQQMIASFLVHVKNVANGYGWTETVFETPNGSENSIMSALHVAELFHKVRVADPWTTTMMGTDQASFTINHVARAGDPAWVETGVVTNIVQKVNGGYSFPELIGGKGGRLINPERNTFGTLWRDPTTGQANATMYVTGANGFNADRNLGTRKVWDAVRGRYDKPAHWSAPGEGSVCLWGRESGNSYAVLAKDPNSESWDEAPSLLPFDTATDPLPVVRNGDTVSWAVTTKRPQGLGTGSTETVSIKITGGMFSNRKDSVTSTVAASAASGWTTRNVSGTVERGGVLTPSVYMAGMDDSASIWARAAVLTITTPAGKTSVYRMQLADFSATVDSMPLDLSNSSGGVGDFSATVKRPELASIFSEYGHRYLYGKRVKLTTNKGIFYGTVADADMTDRHAVRLIGSLALGPLNAYNISAPPYTGTLGELIQLYVGLVAESAPSVSVDPAIGMRPVTYPGWSGDLWPMMKNLCAAHDIQITAREDGSIHFGPGLEGEYDPVDYSQLQETGNPQTLARAVEVVRYEYTHFTKKLVYPDGGWSEDVENITVSPGDTVTYTLDLGTSITDFVQPIHVDYVDLTAADQSVYSIVDEKGRTVTASDWKNAGGLVSFSIGPDRMSILMRISAPSRIMLDDINQVVQSYTFGSRFGDAATQYSTVRIIGSGVGIKSTTLRVPTGVERELTASDVGITIDNPFISTMSQAALAGMRAAITYSGQLAEIMLETQSVPPAGVQILGERMDYRQRSSEISPAGVVTRADYYLRTDTHEAGFAGMTNDDVEDWYAGLTFTEAQNRGRRTATTPWVSYSWLGTPDASESVKKSGGVQVARNLIPDPRCVAVASYRATGILTAGNDGNPFLAIREDVANTSLYVDPSVNFSLAGLGIKVGDVVTVSVEVRTTVERSMQGWIGAYSGATVTYSDRPYVVIKPADGWVRVAATATVTALGTSGYLRALIQATPSNTPVGEGFDIRRYMFTVNNQNAAYFDGSMQGHEQ